MKNFPQCLKPTDAEWQAVTKKAEDIRQAGCEVCAGPVAWFESVCADCVDRAQRELNVGDGHSYDEIWDDKGRRWVCKDCGAHLFQDRIICTRNPPL